MNPRRSLLAGLLTASMLFGSPQAHAEGAGGVAWPASVAGETAFAPRLDSGPLLDSRSLDVGLPSALGLRSPTRLRLPVTPPLRETAMSRDEKVILIVAVSIVGALLLLVTLQIGAHNHP